MQTILGAGGAIATELAREIAAKHTTDLRLVSRNPKAVNATDTLVSADLTDAKQTAAAVAGSDVVYFTAGLPANVALWEAKFPDMVQNSLDAARVANAAFVYFDNTYMYPQDGRVLREDTAFEPHGPKGVIRERMANMVLAEMARGDVPVLIARAPEFYGPGNTQSFTNALILDRLAAGETPRVPVRDDRKRSLIWTPDASRALALLGNTEDAFGQTWHLPVSTEYPTYREFVELAANAYGRSPKYTVVPKWLMTASGIFSANNREIRELLPRYRHDNVFDTTKFASRFPDFPVTSYAEGVAILSREASAAQPTGSPTPDQR